jgi:hypothetical protein
MRSRAMTRKTRSGTRPFLVRAVEYECIYNNMPLRGLANASKHIDAVGRAGTAMGRLGHTDGSDAPVSDDGTEHCA